MSKSPSITEPRASASGAAPSPDAPAFDSPISPAQLAANRANALLSTGPRTPAGLARSSRNAVKSALTGRTVLLPSDDVEEYAAFLAGFQQDLAPIGPAECELVQMIVDCFWRLRRIQALEFALYAHGHQQFEDAFQDHPEESRYDMIVLQTHMTYEKQFRNWQIQENRLDRKRTKAMADLERLQDGRTAGETAEAPSSQQHMSEQEASAALDAGFIPSSISSQPASMKRLTENGFEFSNTRVPASQRQIAQAENSKEQSTAA